MPHDDPNPHPGTWSWYVQQARQRHDEKYAGRPTTEEERERAKRFEERAR